MTEGNDADMPPVEPTLEPEVLQTSDQRPRWPKVIGIISTIYGAFGVTCGGCGIAMWKVGITMTEPLLEGDPTPPTLELGTVDWVLATVGFILSLVILFGGIATIMRSRVGWALHLIYGILSIPVNLYSTLRQFEKQEALQQWLKDYPNNQFAQSQTVPGAEVGQAIGTGIMLLFVLVFVSYSLFCLIWFGLVKPRHEQMTGGETAEVY